jgi:hypothetical protein
MDNVDPTLFVWDLFVVFLQQFYVCQLTWPSCPSWYSGGELYFCELEVLPSDFLKIIFLIKTKLSGPCDELISVLRTSSLTVESTVFLCEFLACDPWRDATITLPSPVAMAFLDRIHHRQSQLDLSDEDQLNVAAGIQPDSDFTAFVIRRWNSMSDFQRIQGALYLNAVITNHNCRQVRDFVDFSLSQELDEISLFHLFLISPIPVLTVALEKLDDCDLCLSLVCSSIGVCKILENSMFTSFAMQLIRICLTYHLPIWQQVSRFFEFRPKEGASFFLSFSEDPNCLEFFAEPSRAMIFRMSPQR